MATGTLVGELMAVADERLVLFAEAERAGGSRSESTSSGASGVSAKDTSRARAVPRVTTRPADKSVRSTLVTGKRLG